MPPALRMVTSDTLTCARASGQPNSTSWGAAPLSQKPAAAAALAGCSLATIWPAPVATGTCRKAATTATTSPVLNALRSPSPNGRRSACTAVTPIIRNEAASAAPTTTTAMRQPTEGFSTTAAQS
ncbi:hypothetical protein G6F66_015293 [Rhizopus arrhizus]|nr:hypothetical protein G6F66_015293 [Rhizopus arrhizus]